MFLAGHRGDSPKNSHFVRARWQRIERRRFKEFWDYVHGRCTPTFGVTPGRPDPAKIE